MIEAWQEAAAEHAAAEAPREACGLVVVVKGRKRYWPCKNISTENNFFVLDPLDYAAAEDAGTILSVVHSHPSSPAVPSEADKMACEQFGLPWHIVGWPTGLWATYHPEGWEPPLLGREWCYGTLDCYALARDWYKQEWGLELSDYERHGEWWFKGLNTFADNFENEGFVLMEPEEKLQYGDALLMQLRSPVSNHAAVYIGDGLILQHLERRLSSRDVLSGYYQKNTTHILRHRSRL